MLHSRLPWGEVEFGSRGIRLVAGSSAVSQIEVLLSHPMMISYRVESLSSWSEIVHQMYKSTIPNRFTLPLINVEIWMRGTPPMRGMKLK